MQMISLLHFIFFLLPLPLASTYGSDCLTRCGNVSIPYPFGVGSGCSLEASFNITCNTSTNLSKPYLNIDGKIVEVVEINPDQIRIKYPHLLSGACYNTSSGNETWSDSDSGVFDLSLTQYTLSENNWLTAVGCDDVMTAVTYVGNEDTEVRDACLGFCSGGWSDNVAAACPKNGDGNSVGEGCCRTPIPRGTNYVDADLSDLSKIVNRTRLYPCSYVFVNEKGAADKPGYSYDLSVLQSNSAAFLQEEKQRPVVRLDWRIGDKNCSQTLQNQSTEFVCGANTDCVDFDAKIGGYLCNCSKGFQGNPYLYSGCLDIDECTNSELNPCDAKASCRNTIGSVNCSCRKGYTGDGRKNGNGCRPSNMIKFISIGLGSALALLVLLLLCFWLGKVFEKRRNKRRKENLFKHLLLQQQTREGAFGKTKLFTAKELEKATDHFNESRICGRGGQGIVYKGMLSDGTIVAIKKLKEVDKNQVEQFINEVVILSQINHKNVVRLLGCCLATETPHLVYEFIPNGTLFHSIHDTEAEFPLTWNMRLRIAADVAGALTYLHSASSIPIYHRDIKSTNILLDEKYIVKVSDFGISKLVEVDQTHLTTLVKGTFGYLDPEYYQTSQYTEKSDVYSFGVILVELLTGQRPISLERSEVGRNLATDFLAYMEANNLDAILDPQVSEEGVKEDVIAVARLARRCLNVKGKMRPTMKEVTIELEGLRISQISLIVDEPDEEATASEAKQMMFSDIEYTWTSNDHNMATSQSVAHPLMSE